MGVSWLIVPSSGSRGGDHGGAAGTGGQVAGGGGADHDQGVHVDHVGVEVGQGREGDLLVGPVGLLDHGDRGGGRAVGGEHGQCIGKVVQPGAAARVVQHGDQVGLCGGADAGEDGVPVGVQVGQRDGGVVVAQGCAEDGGGGEAGGDAGHDLDVDAFGALFEGGEAIA